MLDTSRSEVVWRVMATHSIYQFLPHFPSLRHRVPSHFNRTLCVRMKTVSGCGLLWKEQKCTAVVILKKQDLKRNYYIGNVEIWSWNYEIIEAHWFRDSAGGVATGYRLNSAMFGSWQRLGIFLSPNHSFIQWVNVNVNVKFTLEQATKCQRWSRCIALLFL
jgi:hypothetical protein